MSEQNSTALSLEQNNSAAFNYEQQFRITFAETNPESNVNQYMHAKYFGIVRDYLEKIYFIKKILVSVAAVVVIVLVLSGCAIAVAEAVPTVVIIGGAGSTNEQLDPLHKALPGSVVIIPEKYYPLTSAAIVVRQQIIDKGITGKVILVGWSWGALLAHQINGLYEGFVFAIVGIASPLDIAYIPSFMGAPFNPDDKDSKTPLYVVAGVKPRAEKKWYMTTSESDGIVDLDAAKAVGERNLRGFAVVRGEDAGHWEIVSCPEMIKQVAEWIRPFIASDNGSMNSY